MNKENFFFPSPKKFSHNFHDFFVLQVSSNWVVKSVGSFVWNFQFFALFLAQSEKRFKNKRIFRFPMIAVMVKRLCMWRFLDPQLVEKTCARGMQENEIFLISKGFPKFSFFLCRHQLSRVRCFMSMRSQQRKPTRRFSFFSHGFWPQKFVFIAGIHMS